MKMTWSSARHRVLRWRPRCKANGSCIALNINRAARARSDDDDEYIDTLAHEVNHMLNPVKIKRPRDNFLNEYRAHVVGRVAAGRPVTPAALRAVMLNLVDGRNPDYADIADLYRKDDNR